MPTINSFKVDVGEKARHETSSHYFSHPDMKPGVVYTKDNCPFWSEMIGKNGLGCIFDNIISVEPSIDQWP